MNNKTSFKSGFVAIIGRPNVGKSTLLNQFVKHKVAIVTHKAGTTRNKIQGIYTTSTEQIIFVDTPGIHQPKHQLGNIMNETALGSFEGMDILLYVVEASYPLGKGDELIINAFKKIKCPIILVINKVDLVKDEELLKTNILSYQNAFKFDGGITISATEDFNLDKLFNMIIERLPNGPMYYPEEQILDQPERFVVAEIIREKVLLKTEEEVPHSVAVMIEKFKPNEKHANLLDIHATIIVERTSQKKIIIGANGQKIKEIGTLARKDIVNFLGNKVYLELFVKVVPDWRNKKPYLKEYGY